ncbi:MAG: restriction endonuclease subunit S [bacterium]|nr:restriction endonuclease subunit S [bacterium]
MRSSLPRYPAYKDSGVPWLGIVPEHWDLKRAKWLFQKIDRTTRPQDRVVTCFRDGIVTLRENRRIRGFTESLKEIGYQGVRRGDLVIHAMDAFAGAVGVSDSDGKCTPVYSVCRPHRQVSAHFYAHIVREMARSQWITALAKGIRERSTDFRFDGFAAQLLPVPPKHEQDALARFLDHVDRRIRRYIRAKRRLIALLNEQKQVLIHRAVTRGLDSSVRLKPSGVEWLGEVPEHWEVKRMKELVKESVAGPYGSSLTKAMYTRHGYRVYGQQQVISDDFNIGDYYISPERFAQMQRYQVFPGDVLVSVMGTVGRVAVVPESAEPGIINPRLVRYRPDESQVQARYLQLAMQGSTSQAQLREAAKGTTMEGLNMQILGKLMLVIPPLKEQGTILYEWHDNSYVLTSAEARVRREINLLHEYRTRLIADVVTGKLDVREAAARLPEEPGETDFSSAEEVAIGDTDERAALAASTVDFNA